MNNPRNQLLCCLVVLSLLVGILPGSPRTAIIMPIGAKKEAHMRRSSFTVHRILLPLPRQQVIFRRLAHVYSVRSAVVKSLGVVGDRIVIDKTNYRVKRVDFVKSLRLHQLLESAPFLQFLGHYKALRIITQAKKRLGSAWNNKSKYLIKSEDGSPLS